MRPRGPARPLLALLVLASALAPAAAQGPAPGSPPETPFDPLPREVTAATFGWLDRANATAAGFRAANPGANTSLILQVFLEGAWDFLNESRVSLAMAQLFRVDVEVRLHTFLAATPEAERRAAAVAMLDRETNASRAMVQAFFARLAGAEGGLRTTHGIEVAIQAASVAAVADNLARNAPNLTQQVATAPAAEERVIRIALIAAAAPQSYVRFADDLLALALRVDGEPGRPRAPEGALDLLRERVNTRLLFDQDARSTTGPGSSEAGGLLIAANETGPRTLHFARFVSFEQARAADAVEFLHRRGQLPNEALESGLRLLVDNASWVPSYDGRLLPARPPGLQAGMAEAGYQGLLLADARNHAIYRLAWPDNNADVHFQGLTGAWSQLVGARFAAETFAEVPAARPAPAEAPPVLLYGGVAVAAALAVAGFTLLRRR